VGTCCIGISPSSALHTLGNEREWRFVLTKFALDAYAAIRTTTRRMVLAPATRTVAGLAFVLARSVLEGVCAAFVAVGCAGFALVVPGAAVRAARNAVRRFVLTRAAHLARAFITSATSVMEFARRAFVIACNTRRHSLLWLVLSCQTILAHGLPRALVVLAAGTPLELNMTCTGFVLPRSARDTCSCAAT
jgi:hypothetical protein